MMQLTRRAPMLVGFYVLAGFVMLLVAVPRRARLAVRPRRGDCRASTWWAMGATGGWPRGRAPQTRAAALPDRVHHHRNSCSGGRRTSSARHAGDDL